ncbi:MAG: hypothetical protein K2P81_11590 [Bacteriovoracaceae bacterium]|nr:hypothetical protein [Bacteriovoracaceae bacterium]
MEKALQAHEQFSLGMGQLHPFWIAWVFLLGIANFGIPLLNIRKHPVMAVTLAGAITGLPIGLILTSLFGFSKILGLMHFPWIPVIVYQAIVIRKKELTGRTLSFLKLSFTVSVISIFIDFYDVFQFLVSRQSK